MNKTMCILLVLALSVVASMAQAEPTGITPNEYKQANDLAHSFSDRLLETKDIKLLTRAYFLKDYARRALLNERKVGGEDDLVSMLLPRKTARKVTEAQLRRFIDEENNWIYLSMLYTFSRNSSTNASDDPQPVPPEVLAIVKKDRLFRKIFLPEERTADVSKDVDDSQYNASSVSRFRRLLGLFESVNPTMKRITSSNKSGHTKAWMETMTDFGTRFHYFDPWAHGCNDECFGFPKGTRIITVNVPVFQLAMMQVDGKMKILRALYYTD
jgi:hypothetical protein